MGSKDTSDLVNLGPFMATYVMGNPFGALGLDDNPLQPKDPPVVSTPPLPLPKRQSSSPPKATTNSASKPPALEMASTVTVVSSVEVQDHVSDHSDSDSEVTLSASPHDVDFVVEDENGLVVDTPKAHIGSNANYAKNLRHCTVPDNHLAIQNWIWQHYRYISGYNADTSMDTLLRAVHLPFAHVSRTALCRILQFTFPNCPKKRVATKGDLVYFGLVRRPTSTDYKDSLVMSRVQSHREGGQLTSDVPDDVKEKTISILCWEGDIDCFPPFTQVAKKPVSDQWMNAYNTPAELLQGKTTSGATSQDSSYRPTVPADAEQYSISKPCGRRSSSRLAQGKKRTVKYLFDEMDKLLEDVVSDIDEDSEDDAAGRSESSALCVDSGSDTWEVSSEVTRSSTEVTTTAACHNGMKLPVRRRLPPDISPSAPPDKVQKFAKNTASCVPDTNVPIGVSLPMWVEMQAIIKGQKSGDELWKRVQSVFSGSLESDSGDIQVKNEDEPCSLEVDNDQQIVGRSGGEVTIKEEPVDSGYGDAHPALTGDSSSQSDHQGESTLHGLQRELAETQSLIQAQQSQMREQLRQNKELRKQLETTNKYLHEREAELHHLGTQFFCLATQFYCLNGEIQKFAGQFQKAVNKSHNSKTLK